MRTLPAGEVTLLFTDIDGSTRLLHELGDAYAAVLAEHRDLLRAAFARHGGVEVDTQGDAFFVAFRSGVEAAAAAADAQWELRSGPVRVRMGIHTGHPQVTAEGYVGMDVHRGARIAAAGHGGQVLVSQTTADKLGDTGLGVRDLGEHRLKDLAEPEWLFQLVGSGLAFDFPPLRTLGNTNLPVPGRRLVDRQRPLADLCTALRSGESRMTTVTGTGGTGKTRLAVQAGLELVEHFPNGVFFVGLAPLADASQVVPAVAQTLGVRESPGEPALDTLAGHLRMRRLMLVLDNFEHVVDAAADVSALIASAPGLAVLATSREALRIDAEHELPLAPLGQPDAVELFCDRARSVAPGFEPDGSVVEICRRLDGLPLAIELAAARVRTLQPAELLVRLERRLPLLTGGGRDAPSRQRTLRAAIDWSYELLTEPERRLFRQLAVFAGGCDLEAVEIVCDGDLELLESLIQKNLVLQRADTAGRARYLMLATVREYAEERLVESGEADAVQAAHARYVVELAELAEPHMLGRGQVEWLERLDQELDNIRAAISWLLVAGEHAQALRIASALIDFWDARGTYREARDWLQQGLAGLADGTGVVRARALLTAGNAAFQIGELAEARALTAESLALGEAAGEPRVRTRALSQLAAVAMAEGRFGDTAELAAEAAGVAERAGDRVMLAFALNVRAVGVYELGDPEGARGLFEQGAALLEEIGDRRDLAILQANLGGAALLEEDYTEAQSQFERAIELARAIGDRGRLPAHHHGLGLAALLQGDLPTAVSHLSVALVDGRQVGDTHTVLSTLGCVAGVAARRGDDATAGELSGALEHATAEVGVQLSGSDVLVQPLLDAAAARLGEPAWGDARARGAALTLDAAVDAGLRELDEIRP